MKLSIGMYVLCKLTRRLHSGAAMKWQVTSFDKSQVQMDRDASIAGNDGTMRLTLPRDVFEMSCEAIS